jgi:Na+/H+ antiporter NhaD/arsenite permease-like protein
MSVSLFAAGPPAMPAAAAVPFALLLACVAVLPIAAGHWWHPNRNKGLVAGLLAVPVAVYLLTVPGGPAGLWHAAEEYVQFIALLGSLYAVSGGVALVGDLPARPRTNVLFLAGGAALANVIGTTGASMLLVRPLLRTNSERRNTAHLPVFFIILVSNCGGLLTPLGDPPLFLGFLAGVDFGWTARLWPHWLLVNGVVLAVFYAVERRAYRREAPGALKADAARVHPLRLRGAGLNGPLMLGVIVLVLAKKYVPVFPACELGMLALTLVSLRFTPRSVREANRFTWGPMAEVAVLFAGIFVTMVPALALLNQHGRDLGVTEPWQFFWLTGALSAGLDNAPTYLTMAQLAVVVGGCRDVADLAACRPDLLAAVSTGAVFMGALTYIGNGPNFMVKAIAEESGYRMPSFFGYAGSAAAVLLPAFLGATVVFFR